MAAPLADGAVIRFRQAYHPGGKTYQYAAIKAQGDWFLTGGEKLDPDELCRRLDGENGQPSAANLEILHRGGWGTQPPVTVDELQELMHS